MSRSAQARKPRAESRVRELAAEVVRLKEELRIAAAIEAERPKVQADAAQLAMRLREENTRLIGALAQMFEVCDCGEAHRPTCIGAHDGQAGYGCDACCAHERNENDADGWCVPLRPASDNATPRSTP